MTKRRKAVQRSKKCTGLTYCYDAKHEKAWKSATGAQDAPESAPGAQDAPESAPGAPGQSGMINTPKYHCKFDGTGQKCEMNWNFTDISITICQNTSFSLKVGSRMAENAVFFTRQLI